MAKDRLSAKLAVILHADVAGSTQLVQQDEQLAHERIQNAFQSFSETIGNYQGRVQELRGDALLAEFERASDAVTAALAFQSDQTNYNARLNDDIRSRVRIGVALGEVVIADNTVTGAGVVLAQRVEQLAQPDGLCITGAIHEALPQRMPFDLDSLGEQKVKGFDETVRVYRVALQSGATLPPPEQYQGNRSGSRKQGMLAVCAVFLVIILAAAYWAKPWTQGQETEPAGVTVLSIPDKPSIAVLPFTNMSGDPQQDYFADGITEDLTTDLSKISGLFVVARNSSFVYKGRSVDVRTVSSELGVRYVLEGSVRRSNDQIRINAQLIDGVDGGHIWAERFDGTMANVFSLQDNVNRKIVSALKINLTADDEKKLDKIETSNPDAYDLLLRGVEQYQLFSRETNALARDLFIQAVALDPGYARANANVALSYATDVNFNWTSDREQSIQSGLEYAKKAMELDDSIPQIYLTRSILYLSQRRYDAAIEAALRTIEVHPDYADGQASLAFILSYSGQPQRALEAIHRARQINPQGTGIYLAVEGRILYLLGRYDESVKVLEESLERNPAFDRTQLNLAVTYVQLGRIDDAAWSVEEALAISPDITLEKERRESNYMREQDLEPHLAALRKAGVPEQ
ncbi:MAG: adenylate/guanylate cyclase domain-containing protein [Gammaproteobacteria bacterium]